MTSKDWKDEQVRRYLQRIDAEYQGPNLFCWAQYHRVPCELPCVECMVRCDRADWEDSDVNRKRTAEWLVRREGGL